MKSHEWMIGLAFGFILLLGTVAIFSDDLWHDADYEDAPPIMEGMMAPHRDGRERIACASCHIVFPSKKGAPSIARQQSQSAQLLAVAPPPIHAGIRSPHRDGREKRVCSECHQILSANGRVTNDSRQKGLDAWSTMAPSLNLSPGNTAVNGL
ncbi:MAG: magnetochrome domain-containing protein [Zetaproteobacteria bacterium]|nr:magnetochrome domain-containing protein [Zetaproteobacteria bacterium]